MRCPPIEHDAHEPAPMPRRVERRMADNKRSLGFTQDSPQRLKIGKRNDVILVIHQLSFILIGPCRKEHCLVGKRLFNEWLFANFHNSEAREVLHVALSAQVRACIVCFCTCDECSMMGRSLSDYSVAD